MPFLSLRSSRAGHQAPCCLSTPEADGTSAVHASHPNTPMGGTRFYTTFTVPLAKNEGHSKSAPWKDKHQPYLCLNVHYFMSVCGHAVPDPAPHLPASVLSSLAPSIWCPRGALTIPLPSHIQPLVSCEGWQALASSSYHIQLPHTLFPHQEVLCLLAKITT